jgi:hypothetical protein
MGRVVAAGLLVIAVIVGGFLFVVRSDGGAVPTDALAIVTPTDGTTVSRPVKVMIHFPASIGHGHVHLLIDADVPGPGQFVPMDAQHLHLTEHETEVVLDLPPGEHRLQLLLGCLLGIDAPEEGKRARCEQERQLAKEAGDRLKQLLQGRITLDVRGVDKFGRLLAIVRLSDGRDLGGVMIQEHFAKPYQEGQRVDWC